MLAGPRVLRVLQPFQVLRPECASRRSPELFASTFLLKPVQSNLCGIVFSLSLPRKNRLSAIGITLRRCIFRSRTGRFCLLQPSFGRRWVRTTLSSFFLFAFFFSFFLLVCVCVCGKECFIQKFRFCGTSVYLRHIAF